jgi:hypothetical protein
LCRTSYMAAVPSSVAIMGTSSPPLEPATATGDRGEAACKSEGDSLGMQRLRFPTIAKITRRSNSPPRPGGNRSPLLSRPRKKIGPLHSISGAQTVLPCLSSPPFPFHLQFHFRFASWVAIIPFVAPQFTPSVDQRMFAFADFAFLRG